MRLRTTTALALCWLLLLATLLPGPIPATAATSPGTIAYVRYQAGNGTDIRLIEPDGSNDRRILTVADSPVPYRVPTLAWKPDATELAFASDHEQTTSLFEKELYAVRPDGSGLHKLTNGPRHDQLAGYPRGTVTVDVLAIVGEPVIVYVVGAAAPQTALVSTTATRLTFTNVADLGSGVAQQVVAMTGSGRWYGAAADVRPSQTAHAGSLVVSGASAPLRADNPTWRSDGTAVGFMFGESCGEFRSLPANPPINAQGQTRLKAHSFLGYLCLVDWGPTPALANKLLYNEWDPSTRGIYLTSEGSDAPGELLTTYGLNWLVDLEWLPDGSGFLYSVMEFSETRYVRSNIHEYLFATKQVRQITHFDDEFAGSFSISPDGQQIAFERMPTIEGPTDLWLARRDGSDMRRLAPRAARPAWSRRAPQAAPSFKLYLPSVVRA
jgi:hypothetical protein